MSVHGEYSRALEMLISRVRAVSAPQRETWLAALESARVDRQPDLSAAAECCHGVLDEMMQELRGARSEPFRALTPGEALQSPIDHLRAHCRVILGRG